MADLRPHSHLADESRWGHTGMELVIFEGKVSSPLGIGESKNWKILETM